MLGWSWGGVHLFGLGWNGAASNSIHSWQQQRRRRRRRREMVVPLWHLGGEVKTSFLKIADTKAFSAGLAQIFYLQSAPLLTSSSTEKRFFCVWKNLDICSFPYVKSTVILFLYKAGLRVCVPSLPTTLGFPPTQLQ